MNLLLGLVAIKDIVLMVNSSLPNFCDCPRLFWQRNDFWDLGSLENLKVRWSQNAFTKSSLSKIPPKKFDRFLPWKVALRIIKTNYVYLVYKTFQGRNLSNFFGRILENQWFSKYFQILSDLYWLLIAHYDFFEHQQKKLISSICNKRMITFFRMKSNKGLNEINIIAPETRPMPPSR